MIPLSAVYACYLYLLIHYDTYDYSGFGDRGQRLRIFVSERIKERYVSSLFTSLIF
jgi:hypothetical protein